MIGENKYQYCCLIEETERKIDQNLTVSSWKLSLTSGRKIESYLLYSPSIRSISRSFASNVSLPTLRLIALPLTARKIALINQQYLSKIFNLWKSTGKDWKLRHFPAKILIESFFFFFQFLNWILFLKVPLHAITKILEKYL